MSKDQYEAAKKQYAALGVDTEKAIKALQKISISMHCWQGDDVCGFENDAGATGGIQTTGNYPGKARTPEELMQDVEFAMSLIPGKHRLNLHACYGVHKNGLVDRDEIGPENFIIALDYFDASINRVAAWVLGMRNMQKALLEALLEPKETLKALQDGAQFTEQLVLQEELKTYPMGAVWQEFCDRAGLPANETWMADVLKYERDVLSLRA